VGGYANVDDDVFEVPSGTYRGVLASDFALSEIRALTDLSYGCDCYAFGHGHRGQGFGARGGGVEQRRGVRTKEAETSFRSLSHVLVAVRKAIEVVTELITLDPLSQQRKNPEKLPELLAQSIKVALADCFLIFFLSICSRDAACKRILPGRRRCRECRWTRLLRAPRALGFIERG